MPHSSSEGHEGYIVWPQKVGSRKNPGVSPECLSVWRWQSFNRLICGKAKVLLNSLVKVPRFTGSLWAGALSFSGVMREGLSEMIG